MGSYVNGGATIEHTAAADLAAGDFVLVGTLIGMASRAFATGASGTLLIAGRVRADKLTGASTGGAAGAIAYWNAAGSKFTAASSGNTVAGKFALACGDNDTTCEILLNI